ncbi:MULTISPECIES: DUF4943 family protein [unclassified Carboxylicivirga]|uniref:DUF4943 family protein n=1 Tax=Carboxylicivirga TaxID=1628153 RepID=UPI003D349F0A
MKTLKFLVFCILSFSVLSCDNDENNEANRLSVEEYIDHLKAGKYDSLELPNFTSKDIPALLKYRNETQMIEDFPVNGISSFYMPECPLGMYALWTIESIRAVAIDSEYLIGRFPSQNPIVKKKGDAFEVESGSEIQKIVAKAYFDWWAENKNLDFAKFKNTDPLSETDYTWH